MTLFLLQPTILNSMSRMISCIQLGENEFVVADMNLKCWGSEHLLMVFVFSIPSLLVWNLVFPLFCLYMISKKKHDLKDESTVLKFGFLYNGFDEKSYYWGFVKYFQKVIIILLRMSNIDVGLKMLSILLIWILSVSFKKFRSNYVHSFLNDMEYTSNFINMLSLFLSLYVIMGISDVGKSFIFVALIGMNIYFIAYWAKGFLFSKKNVLRTILGKINERLRNSLISRMTPEAMTNSATGTLVKPSKFSSNSVKPKPKNNFIKQGVEENDNSTEKPNFLKKDIVAEEEKSLDG